MNSLNNSLNELFKQQQQQQQKTKTKKTLTSYDGQAPRQYFLCIISHFLLGHVSGIDSVINRILPMGNVGFKIRWADTVISGQPGAQGVTPRSRDRVPHRAPCVEPAPPSARVSVSAPLSGSLRSK